MTQSISDNMLRIIIIQKQYGIKSVVLYMISTNDIKNAALGIPEKISLQAHCEGKIVH